MEFNALTYALGHLVGGLLVLYAAGWLDRRREPTAHDAGLPLLFLFWPIIFPCLLCLWVLEFIVRRAYMAGRGQ